MEVFMAKKHINRLIDNLKIYFERLNRLDSEAVSISSKKMIDPGDWAEITESLRRLSIHLSNLNSLLAMALDSADFLPALNSRRNLVKSIEEVLSRVKSEQPDSSLILGYENMLISHRSILLLLDETEKFRSYPNSDKKYKRWIKRGLIDFNYKPFKQVEEDMDKIGSLLAQEGV